LYLTKVTNYNTSDSFEKREKKLGSIGVSGR
jgi:hypothetical protein